MIKLMVSQNCGISYYCEKEANEIEELEQDCKDLDSQTLRWYLEDSENPNVLIDRPCAIHAELLEFMKQFRT